jgi:hypothetical protein
MLPKNRVWLNSTMAKKIAPLVMPSAHCNNGGREPVARQKRKHREPRFRQQPVQRLQRALVQQIVIHRIGLPPEGHEGEQQHSASKSSTT